MAILIETIGEFLIELGLEAGKESIKDRLDEHKLRDKLKDYIERQEKYNLICDRAEEIDFQGFINYISDNICFDINKGFFSANREGRRKASEQIISAATAFSKANTEEAKERVKVLVSDCLEIIYRFYKNGIEKKDYILALETVDAVAEDTERIVSAANTKLQQAIRESTADILIGIDGLKSGFGESRISDTAREALGKELKASLKREIALNPSMLTIHPEKDIFPKAHFEPLNTLVQVGAPEDGGRSDTMSLWDALNLAWKQETARHIALFGIGGLGKTTSLLSTDWPVPTVYIPLRNFTDTTTIDSYIRTNTLGSNDQLYRDFTSLCSESWTERPHVILILDGVNEIDSEGRSAILKDIAFTWSIRPGIQLIVASRYDISADMPNVRMLRLHLEPLTRPQISTYLKKLQIGIPDASNRLWRVIDTPLMLNLYARGQLLKLQYGADPDIALRESINAGTIIWNYLQSEIYRCKASYENIVNTTIAAEYIAPFIAYRMQQSGKGGMFSLSRTELIDWIQEAYASFRTRRASGNLPPHLYQVVMREEEAVFQAARFYKLLTSDMCLFLDVAGNIQLMHQHFRDALAALYLYQMAEIAAERVPEEWKRPLDQYVGEFLSDLLQDGTEKPSALWQKIWTLFRTEQAGRETSVADKAFVEMMLQLYKRAFSSDISEIDFSAVDLSDISLVGYRLTPASSGHFVDTVIGDGTFGKDGHRMMICAISWSPSGNRYMSASHDCTIMLWDAKTEGIEKINLDNNPHTRYIRCAQWCPTDERVIVSSGDDMQLIRWTFDGTRWAPEVIGECGDWTYSLVWDPDGEAILCGDRKGNISLFSKLENRTYRNEHNSIIGCLAYSRRNLFASGSDNGLVCIWDRVNETPLLRLHFKNTPIKSLQWAGGDSVFAVFAASDVYFIDIDSLLDDGIKDWDEQTGSNILWRMTGRNISSAVLNTCDDTDYCAIFFQNAVEVYQGNKDKEGHYQLFMIASREINERDLGIIACAAWDQSCSRLIFGSRNGSLWSAKLLRKESTLDRIQLNCVRESKSNSVRCSAWNQDGSRLAAGYDDGMIRIWDVANQRCTQIFEGHNDSVKCIIWSPDTAHNLIASGSDDGSIRLWSYGETVAPPETEQCFSPINCIAWLKNGKLVAGSDNQRLIIWDRETGKSVHLDGAHESRIYSILISASESYAISAGDDRMLCIWKLSDEIHRTTCVQRIQSGHKEPIRGLSWSPGENGIFSGSNDKMLFFRAFGPEPDLLDKGIRILSPHHNNFIYSVTLSGNGKYVITGSTDTTLGFWDASELNYLTSGKDHSNFVWNISASPEINQKYYVASSSSDGTLKIWDVTDVEAGADLHSLISLEVLPGVHIVGCDFRGARIQSERLRELIHMNGGVVD